METVMEQVGIQYFGAVYDPANYVFCGFDPWEAWQMTKPWTVHFHIKDWVRGENHGRLAGEGHERIAEVMAAPAALTYNPFPPTEPPLLRPPPTGPSTPPTLSPK